MSKNKHKAVIFDLDGTLADVTHRLHYAKNKDWDAFNQACNKDLPKKDMIKLLKLFVSVGYIILIVTGRYFGTKKLTIKWLSQHQVPYTLLCMRDLDDRRQSCKVKYDLYKKHIESVYDVQYAVDDRSDSADMWRTVGITCLEVWSEWNMLNE